MAYKFRRVITVSNTQVSGTVNHPNFPMYVDIYGVEDRVATSYWDTPTYGTWDGSEWDSETLGPLELIDLTVAPVASGVESPWDYYRPNYVRVTFTKDGGTGPIIMRIYDTNGDDMLNGGAGGVNLTATNQTFEITHNGFDIDRFAMAYPEGFAYHVQSIEFFDFEDLKTRDNGGDVYSSSGHDIIFTVSSGTCAHEITNYSPTTGRFSAWVKVPTLYYNQDTEIIIRYGNPNILTATENPSQVWSDYTMVWHLDEGVSTAANFYQDSTGNGNNGTLTSPQSNTTSVDGQIDDAINFFGNATTNADFISRANMSANFTNSVTLTGWFKVDNLGFAGSENEGAFGIRNNLDTDFYVLVLLRTAGPERTLECRVRTLNGVFPANITQGVTTLDWHYASITYNGTNITSYLNGKFGNQTGATGSFGTATVPFVTGALNTGGGFEYDGSIDEVRLTTLLRSGDWFTTEYNNQLSPNDFYSIGPRLGSGKFIQVPGGSYYIQVPFGNVESIMGVPF